MRHKQMHFADCNLLIQIKLCKSSLLYQTVHLELNRSTFYGLEKHRSNDENRISDPASLGHGVSDPLEIRRVSLIDG